jgi:hypothetical protein
MNSDNRAHNDQQSSLEEFAAELTDAAYCVALHHGVVGSSVDLELALWHVLSDAVRKWEQELPL